MCVDILVRTSLIKGCLPSTIPRQHIGTGVVVQWVERRNSNPKTYMGSIPPVGQGEGQFFFPSAESTLVQDSLLCLTHLHVYDMHPHLCACLISHIRLS